MLLEMGISERALEYWHSMAELGLSPQVYSTYRLSLLCRVYMRHKADYLPLCVELQNCSIPSVWVRFRYAWGHKMQGDGTVIPSIPVEGLTYQPIPPHLGGQAAPFDAFGQHGKYPQVHYYPTAERAYQWAEWRAMERARLGIEPWPERCPWQ